MMSSRGWLVKSSPTLPLISCGEGGKEGGMTQCVREGGEGGEGRGGEGRGGEGVG